MPFLTGTLEKVSISLAERPDSLSDGPPISELELDEQQLRRLLGVPEPSEATRGGLEEAASRVVLKCHAAGGHKSAAQFKWTFSR